MFKIPPLTCSIIRGLSEKYPDCVHKNFILKYSKNLSPLTFKVTPSKSKHTSLPSSAMDAFMHSWKEFCAEFRRHGSLDGLHIRKMGSFDHFFQIG